MTRKATKATTKPVTVNAKTKGVLTTVGKTLANAFMNADNVATQAKKELLLASAETYSKDDAKAKIVLDSYANTFVEAGHSKNTAKSRKSEARRVFEAVGATNVSGENLKQLQEFDGGYHEFIGLARDLSTVETKAKKAASNRTPKITPIQEQAILDKLPQATVIQLSDFVETASETLNAPREAESAALAEKQQFILLASISDNMLKNEQYDDTTHKAVKQVLDIVNVQIGRITAVQQQATKAMKEATPVKATA